jgi:hypothetical protein
LAFFMILTSVAAIAISSRVYVVKKPAAMFLLGSTVFLLVLSMIVANSLISIQ